MKTFGLWAKLIGICALFIWSIYFLNLTLEDKTKSYGRNTINLLYIALIIIIIIIIIFARD